MRTPGWKAAVLLGALATGLAACVRENAPTETEIEADENAARAAEAVANPARSGEDRADDALRKPANVLAFMEVGPGDRVFEMEGGAGYYTELLSYMVGPDGAVIMQNPPSFDAFVKDIVTARVEGRLENVRISKSPFDKLEAEDASMDIVTWILGPHDLYYSPGGAYLGDDAGAFAEIMRILKPGGTFIVLDHVAAPGSPRSTGGVIHRIDPALIRQLAAEAGFVMTGESNVLRHGDDDYLANVFDPKVRRMTDRVLYKYKKPE
ncbi:methyltransferase domain-containing protein [Hyphococcus luteus]|uniref:Methyltransferase n=1 Tax=Hyphococcus luteus TaxID=2058213 RepID=A0A2S7K5D6_9PROT|nr:methyltransferase domain-containing protein [Marinicaulis flavus]PQA87725.1 methyltransferase [Marinicaulis flavus]